jgi:GTP diphosphokinase / guanosine-3',5'-bis(diphosphate) 3'-diphosphatase
MHTIGDVLANAKTYISNPKHLSLIEDAFQYANKFHAGQNRHSGEAYINHPVNVAYILTEYHTGPSTIISGLLHDVLEDTPATYQEVTELFGKETADIIQGVTKLTGLNFTSKDKVIAENHMKMMLAMTEDIRVIVVKLADRLHNMRTIEFLPQEKILIKCRETMDIFVPLAHRLGMYRLKAELEDIAFKYLEPQSYELVSANLEMTKEQRDKDLAVIVEDLHEHLSDEGIEFEIKGRIKNTYSIAKKMRTKGKDFFEIFDLLALRIIVNTAEECYKVLGIIHHHYKPIPKRFKDYIAIPKANMYQSLHTTILTDQGKIFEVQIRTQVMDAVAEIGIAAHWAYKEGKTKQTEQQEIADSLQWYANVMRQLHDDDDPLSSTELLDSIKEELTANVFVFTPNGDVHMLPLGATPVDFAYRIHTRVGDTCVGAIVNNRMVPLDYELQTGDICNIKTNKSSKGPSDTWLNIAKTSHARAKIKNFLNKRDRDLLIEAGKRKVEEALHEYSFERKIDDDLVQEYFDTPDIFDVETLYYAIGKNIISARGALNKLSGRTDVEKDPNKIIESINRQGSKSKPSNIHGIMVEGLDNPKVKLSNCCNPIPGDPIVGYVSKGMGIAIHRDHCPNITDQSERHIGVTWTSTDQGIRYPVNLKISATSTASIMVEIINYISSTNAVVVNVNTKQNKDSELLIKLGLSVFNADQLDKIIVGLRNFTDVYQVERTYK